MSSIYISGHIIFSANFFTAYMKYLQRKSFLFISKNANNYDKFYLWHKQGVYLQLMYYCKIQKIINKSLI